MKRFVVYEERFVTVGDQVTCTEDGVVRFDDHFRHLVHQLTNEFVGKLFSGTVPSRL